MARSQRTICGALLALVLTSAAAQSCEDSCSQFIGDLNKQNSINVFGDKPVTSAQVSAMCSEDDSVTECGECGGVGLNLDYYTALGLWLITCLTYEQTNVSTALECWNSDYEQHCADVPGLTTQSSMPLGSSTVSPYFTDSLTPAATMTSLSLTDVSSGGASTAPPDGQQSVGEAPTSATAAGLASGPTTTSSVGEQIREAHVELLTRIR
jgi:hypothetical protein